MPSNLNEKQLKELVLAANSKQEVLNVFKSLGFTVEEGEESSFVNISNNDLIEIIFFSSMPDFLSSAKSVSLGKYCTLGISEDFEDWIFAKSVIEDGRKLKKFKFSKTKLRETPKPIAIKKLLNFKANDLKSFEDIFKRKDVTKDFYKKFEKLIEALIKKITGIKSDEDKKWYASVIINRILFIYFIQHKELLGNRDKAYLSKHLKVFSKKKKDSYFRDFLRPLFFEGLAKKEKSPELRTILENVPYLNGGLFQEHILEKENPEISIPDAIFESIFTFLDEWNWHLDEKRDTEENEINPEVIGYIFEQLINQKQMGAYYTKEDITGYISKNTIIPRLLDMVKEKHPEAFAGNPNLFQPIFDNPDAFIYESVLHGIYSDFQKKTIRELPPNIAAGIKDVSKRTDWNKTADEEYALPTETWREVVARRQRYFEIKAQLEKGLGFDAKSQFTTNDLITYNLNIIDFILHTINNGTFDFVKSFYDALRSITILDPTCGSGAFLLASLNILEDMYEACLDRLQDVRNRHACSPLTQKYQIYKTIILNNLYGVDIMEEAVEICKLRLFLKLISCVERNDDLPNLGIEPLPDIDFNILSGNTLVGFSKMSEVEKAFEAGDNNAFNFYAAEIDIIKKHAGDLEVLHHKFIQYQADTSDSPKEPILTLKDKIRQDSKDLNDKLNLYLAKLYGVNIDKKKDLEAWKISHKPFHWVVEFYGIISKGGFDVIVGNPPYVEYSKVKSEYTLRGYETLECGNLYVYTIERGLSLSKNCCLGYIIPSAAFGTVKTKKLRDLLTRLRMTILVSYFSGDAHPAILFEGVKLRLAILLTLKGDNELYTTSFKRWYSQERENLFSKLRFSKGTKKHIILDTFPKCENEIEIFILKKIIASANKKISDLSMPGSNYKIYYHNAPVFFIRSMNFTPLYESNSTEESKSNHFKTIHCKNEEEANILICLISSSIYFFWYTNYSANRDLTSFDLNHFPIPIDSLIKDATIFTELVAQLMEDLNKKSVMREYNYTTGKVRYQEFYVRLSKPIIDEIDRVLAKHYNFTEEELDYIINYDIKYRMGAEGNEE
ncbi:MAG: Eco57I restriction-modification methylase domain-containing protein [Leptospiraceae bacterium]|nr:Eco57I restriction-modification methylase domain-containing protein [Leptospiraceae bacterium]